MSTDTPRQSIFEHLSLLGSVPHIEEIKNHLLDFEKKLAAEVSPAYAEAVSALIIGRLVVSLVRKYDGEKKAQETAFAIATSAVVRLRDGAGEDWAKLVLRARDDANAMEESLEAIVNTYAKEQANG